MKQDEMKEQKRNFNSKILLTSGGRSARYLEQICYRQQILTPKIATFCISAIMSTVLYA